MICVDRYHEALNVMWMTDKSILKLFYTKQHMHPMPLGADTDTQLIISLD